MESIGRYSAGCATNCAVPSRRHLLRYSSTTVFAVSSHRPQQLPTGNSFCTSNSEHAPRSTHLRMSLSVTAWHTQTYIKAPLSQVTPMVIGNENDCQLPKSH